MEWVEKLFNCMEMFYGERWKSKSDLAKTVWQSALQGLSYDEIRNALVIYKRESRNKRYQPPDVFQFFKRAKFRGIDSKG